MITVTVCVGSSCYVRGSDKVAATFQELIDKEGLQAKVEMVGAFCMENCSLGISIRVEDQVFRGIDPAQAEAFFHGEIMPLVREKVGV